MRTDSPLHSTNTGNSVDAFVAVEEMLHRLPPKYSDDNESRSTGSDESQPRTEGAEDTYSVQFLTYAYTVPFRLVAVQQELSDIFGFAGVFNQEFIDRWTALSPPEQAAFSQSYREYRRMESLARSFAEADKADPPETSTADRAGRFVVAHLDGLEEWQYLLQEEAMTASNRASTEAASPESVTVPLNNADGAGALATLSKQSGSSPVATADQLFGAGGDAQASIDLDAIVQQLAPIDDLARDVLDRITEAEIAEARRRFLVRVRWMMSLPNQQRMAIAMRTTGRKRREIAKAMGISEESVKTHLARADDDWRQRQPVLEAGKGKRSNSRG